MPLFSIKAVNSSGVRLKEVIEAPDINVIKDILKERSLIPVEIKEISKRRPFFKKINEKDILSFTQELRNLLEAGLGLDRALRVLSEHSAKPVMREIISKVYLDIEQGLSLSQSLAKHREFSSVYVNMIRSGEMSGALEASLKRLEHFLEINISTKDEIKGALIYPALLTGVGIIALGVIIFYVIPRFKKMFEELGSVIPFSTQIVFSVSSFLSSFWWIIAGAFAFILLATRYYIQLPQGRNFIDDIKLRIPVLKEIFMRLAVARFSRTLGSLLQGGVPLLESIRLAREVAGNRIISEKLKPLEEGVRKGRGVAIPLKESGAFPPVLSQMVSVGEEAGRLEETFLSIAERYEREVTSHIKRLIGLFEPIMIIVMGTIVAVIVISMLLAIFSINEMPI
ncbi:MAG: type II secretion system F family protein [Thermodesulfovibrionales bacterium]|nr:type II secretion system F family protein [Thermodesulfovibrionales bacterium]